MVVIGNIMELKVIFLLGLSVLPNYYTFCKIRKRQDLNVVDVFLAFSTLYYILTPIKCILSDVYYRTESVLSILNHSGDTLIYICMAFYFLLLINIVLSRSKSNAFRFLNISWGLRYYNQKVNTYPSVIYLYLVCFLFILYSITNYSALSADNVEMDRTWKYAGNTSFIERCIINFVSVGFPVFILLTIRYLMESRERRYKRITSLTLIVSALCLLLGSRTQMMQVSVVSMIYLYSCYREKIKKKHFVIALVGLVMLPLVVFPISQQFRIAKVLTVERGGSHAFSDVVSTFINLSGSTKTEVVSKALQSTDGRSMNVFVAFDESVNNSYLSTNGRQTLDQLLCIFPLHKPESSLSNINAELLEGGGDIAESLFTVMYVDLGLFGIFVVGPILMCLIFFLITLLCKMALHLFGTYELMLLSVVHILSLSVSIEGMPSVRAVYNPNLIVIIMFGLIFSFYNKKINA